MDPSVLLRLHPASGVVWYGGRRFLDATTGGPTPDPAGWTDADDYVDALTSAPGGHVAWSSHLYLDLGGTNYFQMGFVSETGH